MTEAQFAKKLEGLCQAHIDSQVAAAEKYERQHQLTNRKVTLSTPQREAMLVDVVLPNVEETIHRLDGLRPPRSREPALHELQQALARAVKTSRADPSWIATHESEPFQHAREVSLELEAEFCGEP